jgi:hypothetical protein
MNVSAIIVTRGDVDIVPILDSLPAEWEVLVWDNGRGSISRRVSKHLLARIVTGEGELPDLAVYGRYRAIEYATNDLIYVQDDDCVVSDPAKIARIWGFAKDSCQGDFDPHLLWRASPDEIRGAGRGEHVVCNMPPQFRHDFYRKHALVGFGAVFQRDAPQRAFRQWDHRPTGVESVVADTGLFHRRCDLVFTALTTRVLVDVPYEDLPWASDDNRMWKRSEHQGEGQQMLDLVLKVRDGS